MYIKEAKRNDGSTPQEWVFIPISEAKHYHEQKNSSLKTHAGNPLRKKPGN